ncbi:MAG: coat protein [Oscillospiraceae bacterium]|nr:coat protein [Oscillospiraceae bacterium]
MAKTKIADLIVPELFAPYVINQTKELSNLINSGIAQSNPLLDSLIEKGGKTVNMPFMKALTGSDEVLSDSEPLVPEKISADKDVAPVLIRGKAWSANELAGALAGNDPMSAAGEQIAKWWNVQEQKILIAILNGIFAEALADSHCNDISEEDDDDAIISANALLDTKQLLGDAASDLKAIAMHSAVFTTLQKQNLIEYIPNSEGIVEFPVYLGYKVIVDDGIIPVDGVYSTYLFADGVFGRGDGVPDSLTPVEMSRDALASDDILVSRRALCFGQYSAARRLSGRDARRRYIIADPGRRNTRKNKKKYSRAGAVLCYFFV